MNFRPMSAAAAQGKSADETFIPPLQTPQLYSRLVSLGSNLESVLQMSSAIRQAGVNAGDIDESLMNLARLLPAFVREADGSIARKRLEHQISQNVLRLMTALASGAGASQASGAGSLASMNRLKELIADFGQGKNTVPSGMQSMLGDLLGQSESVDQLSSQLRNLAETLRRGLLGGDLKNAGQLRQLAGLINQSLQTNSLIMARLPVLHATVGNLLFEATAVSQPGQHQPMTDWAALVNSGTLSRELSMTRLLAAHAATSQFVELSRMKQALGKARTPVEKGKKDNKNKGNSPEENLFENFLTFFSP